ncbi:MAG: antibiotic biosynthesis monooxygenase [Pseudomonadota bacterium]
MLAICVDIEVAADRFDEFLTRMKEQARSSVENEPGCKQFDVCLSEDLPGHIFLYELYDDQSAFDDHMIAEHSVSFIGWARETATKMEARRYETVIA